MEKQIAQLKEFHNAFKLPRRDNPEIIPLGEFDIRHKLLIEEVGELLTAYNDNDIVEVADAIVDSMYVLIGTALQFGLTDVLEECFDEVHRSNMSKLDENGNPIFRADGKVMKSDKFSKPDLKRLI